MSSDQPEAPHRLTVSENGHVVAEAVVRPEPQHDRLRAELHAEPGHHRPGAHAEIVDAVVDHAVAEPLGHVHAAMPAGNAEMLGRLQERCDDVETHRAGSTVIAEGSVPDQRA